MMRYGEIEVCDGKMCERDRYRPKAKVQGCEKVPKEIRNQSRLREAADKIKRFKKGKKGSGACVQSAGVKSEPQAVKHMQAGRPFGVLVLSAGRFAST